MSARPPIDRPQSAEPRLSYCADCAQHWWSDLGHACPCAETHRGGVLLWVAVAIALLLASGALTVSARGAAPRSGSALLRATRIVDAHPAWRDGHLRRGRIAGCTWQTRVWRDGHGYAGVTCGLVSGVALRDAKGRWLA